MATGKYIRWSRQEDIALRLIYANPDSLQAAGLLRAFAARKGIPRSRCYYRASEIGLSRERHKAWTEDERDDLRYYGGVRSVRWIARKLGRTRTSVHVEMSRLKVSGTVRDRGCRTCDLQQFMGIDERTLRVFLKRWPMEKNEFHNFAPAIVQAWIWAHLEEFELRKMDQRWLKSILIANRPSRAGNKLASLQEAQEVEHMLHLARKCA